MMRRSVGWLVGLVVVAQLAAGTAAVADSGIAATPGSRGAGDVYYPRDGNGGFTVDHYDLNLRYWPGSALLGGTATLDAHATQALSRFDLDFWLNAGSVTVNGEPAAFEHRGQHELVITPAHAVASGAAMRVVVTYRDRPERIRLASGVSRWRSVKGSAFINGEPHGAAVWYPVSDHPSDKATYDFRIAVPRAWKAIAPGALVGHRVAATYSVWSWQVTAPMASYLSFLALGDYTLASGTAGATSYTYAWWSRFPPKMQATMRRALAKTPQYVAWLSSHLGPYPFDHIGGTAVGGFAVATIESQSAPVYGHYLFQRRALVRATMVHELAHQWFGDSVSLWRWHDLWLNEGFATYLEWWYAAAHGGPSLNAQMLAEYRASPANDPWWTIAPLDTGPGSRMFTSVYGRGAMTLQALCNVVGPAAFHRIVRTWVRTHRYRYGTTQAFVALAEQISGRDLSRLFWVWLHRPHRPAHTTANGFPDA